MFGLSLISTKKLNHLASECSKLAIANVELSKQNATQSKNYYGTYWRSPGAKF